MKVASVTATFPPYWGGTGNVAYHNARLLHERGYDVTVFTAATSRDAEMEFPFQVERLPAVVRIGNAPLTPGLFSKLGGFDLIHLHFPFIFGAELAFAASKLRRVPMLATYHNDLLAGGLRGAFFRVYTAVNQRLILDHVTALAATSQDYAENSHLAATVAKRGVSVLPNGVDTTFFAPTGSGDRPALRAIGQPATGFYALFVGGLDTAHHFKGVEVLIEAVGRVPNARAVIVGEGDMRSTYEAQARAVAPGRVAFTGKVDMDRLAGLYRDADVTVLPSRTQGEAFGMVLIESMAAGTPVIATDLPGVRTVVRNGVDGLLVPPDDVDTLVDALAETMSSPERAVAMGRAGLEKTVRLYDWERVGDRLEELCMRAAGL